MGASNSTPTTLTSPVLSQNINSNYNNSNEDFINSFPSSINESNKESANGLNVQSKLNVHAPAFIPDPKMYNVHSINLHKSSTPMLELQSLMHDEHVSIALIQEPPLEGGLVKDIDDFNCIARPNARAAIISLKHINLISCDDFCDDDLSVCLVQDSRTNNGMLLVSIYMDGELPIELSLTKLDNIISFAEKNGLRLIISGDFNAWSHAWGKD